MAISTITAELPWDVHSVWNTVTSVRDYTWRSDLERTESLNERQFVEYTKKGYATTFTITASEPCRRWEFDMENSSMSGHWTGIFSSKGEGTEICFTEEVRAKRFFLKPFIKRYLKTQQARFVADLEAELRCRDGSDSSHR